MGRQEQLDILRKGVQIWNIWRQQHLGTSIDLSGADLSGADLSGADLSGADLSGADLRDAHLSVTDLRDAHLSRADLSGADLSGANLSGADLYRANLSGADLRGAHLSRADLSGADLFRANLSYVNLSGADLDATDLRDTHLNEADLSSAKLSSAKLSGADLFRANLRDAHLNYVDLSYVNLSYVNLSGADLFRTIVGGTFFGDVDLRTVKNLETIQHKGPSYVSTSALSRSQGDIPDLFLRGAGLDDTFITYVRSLTSKPIEYYTCFISYSSKDELFAKRLHNDLQQEGVRCWFAPEDMDIGDKIRHRIEESIRLYDKLLLILSEHSLASNWVAYEVERAVNKEPQGQPNVLYPVRVDKAIMTCTKSWVHDIKSTRHIGNFEDWTDPPQYEENFKRLLRALNTKKEQQKN